MARFTLPAQHLPTTLTGWGLLLLALLICAAVLCLISLAGAIERHFSARAFARARDLIDRAP